MLHRGPVVITSLEEDFKKIGLISESKSNLVEETEATENAEEENETPEANETEEDGQREGESLDEYRIRRRVQAGTRRLGTTKRTPASARIKSKRTYRKKRLKVKMARKKAMRSPKKRRRAKALRKMASKRRGESSENSIANLIEEVQDIVTSLGAPKSDESIKSFANIAIISDMLANTFGDWSNNLDESFSDQATYDLFIEAAESLADLAEAASEIATALKAGETFEETEGETLETIFKEYMEDLLDGMDLYNEAMSELGEGDTMHGKAGNIGQPNAIKKKGKVAAEAAEGDDEGADDEQNEASDEDDDEDDDEGDEDDADDDEDEEEPEEESKKKRPSKR